MHIMKLAAVNVGGQGRKKKVFDFLEFIFMYMVRIINI